MLPFAVAYVALVALVTPLCWKQVEEIGAAITRMYGQGFREMRRSFSGPTQAQRIARLERELGLAEPKTLDIAPRTTTERL